jgi:hypothetical protein
VAHQFLCSIGLTTIFRQQIKENVGIEEMSVPRMSISSVKFKIGG